MKQELSTEAKNRIQKCKKNKSASLDLSYLELTEIPKEISELTWLESLSLSRNKISKIENLKRFKNLSNLNIALNRIAKLENLEGLINLSTIHISHNQISKIENLEKLENLYILDLGKNQITKFEGLKHLNKLGVLYLEKNLITEIELAEIPISLHKLILSQNPINSIKSILPLLASNRYQIAFKNYAEVESGEIGLFNCPLTTPPIEIIKQGNTAIKNYFKQLDEEDSVDYLFESKLLILGAAGSGKTSFAWRLENPKVALPGKGDSTHGIQVNRWKFPIAKDEIEDIQHKSCNFFVNLWDFGGQDIYHGTHQFFFSKKSLYVLVADTREQKADFNYWLNAIEQLSGDESTLFILLNKRENHEWKSAVAPYTSRYGHIIKGEKTVDLSNSTAVVQLQSQIKELLKSLPSIGVKLIESWVKVREAMSKMDEDFINLGDFRTLCNKYGSFSDDDIVNISRYFHDIGVFTHYIDDDVLQERIYLNSNWLVKTVYQLLDSEEIEAHKGRITLRQINKIWSDQKFEIKKLIRLLEKFGLMYPASEKQFIVPIHLKSDQPYERWDYEDQNPILHFRYTFDNFMPKGIMSKLIVALHRYIPDHNKVWERGFNISHNEAHAEIVAPYGGTNYFDIRICGFFQRDLLVIIIQAFEKILSEFTKLNYKKHIKCPCSECVLSETPYFFDTIDIENAVVKKVIERSETNPKIDCRQSYENVALTDLLLLIDYENIMNHIQQKSPNKFNRTEDQLDNLLKIVKGMDSKMDSLILIKELNSENYKYVKSIYDHTLNIEGGLFTSIVKEQAFYKKVDKYFKQLPKEERLKLEGWQNADDQLKLRSVINLGFLKFERELEAQDGKAPTNWEELKQIFDVD